MDGVKIPKGVAMMIRAVLNIDPEKIEHQINTVFAKCMEVLPLAQNTLATFDERMQSLEAAHKEIAAQNARIIQLLEGNHHGTYANGSSRTPLLLSGNGGGERSDDHAERN